MQEKCLQTQSLEWGMSAATCTSDNWTALGGVCVVSCYRLSDSVRRERGEAAALIKNLIMFEMLRRNSVFTSP